MVSVVYHYRCESCGKTSATRPGIEGSAPHSTVPHREGAGGVRKKGGQAVGPIYDIPRHTGDFSKMVDLFKQHGGLFLDYPVYMRPIGGGWC